ncbi:MAG: YfiR family protein [Flavobacteriales bacterium]|nr:YfiR family protein [Flavobacteriales bacterium]
MKRLVIISLFLVGLLTSAGTSYKSAEKQNYDTNAKMKAVFVYNFTRYIEWPEEYKQGNFVIGLLGETPITAEIDKVAATKKAVNQTIEIKKFNSLSDISECHILYVASSNSGDLSAALQKTKGRSTLVITEQDGLAVKGAGISFKVVNNRQKFEINKRNIENRKMIVGSALLSLAIVVD